MATAADENGIPRYDETDAGANGTFSGFMNRGLDWVSSALGRTGAAGTFTMQNSFVVFDTNRHELTLGDVEVSLSAAIPNNGAYGAGVTIATLPAGRRPRVRQTVIAIFSGTAKEVNIETDGRIRINGAGNGGVAFTTMFRAAR